MNKMQLFFDRIYNYDPSDVTIVVVSSIFAVIVIYMIISSYLNAKKIKKQKEHSSKTIRVQRDAVGRRVKR